MFTSKHARSTLLAASIAAACTLAAPAHAGLLGAGAGNVAGNLGGSLSGMGVLDNRNPAIGGMANGQGRADASGSLAPKKPGLIDKTEALGERGAQVAGSASSRAQGAAAAGAEKSANAAATARSTGASADADGSGSGSASATRQGGSVQAGATAEGSAQGSVGR